MEINQLLITVALTVTTLLVVAVGLQLIFALKELRKTIKKAAVLIDDIENGEIKMSSDMVKDKVIIKKHLALHSILDKMRILTPRHTAKNKKLFVKDSK